MSAAAAWALLAVSSDAQAETLEHQRAWAMQTASDNGWRITRFFEGVASGKIGPRKIVRDLLVDLRDLPAEQRPSWLLMIRLDRIGRGSIVESQVAVHELKEFGVRVWTRDAGEVRIDNAMDQLIVAVQSAVSTHENEVRIDKARNVYRRKRAAGLVVGNQRPYGLRLTSDGRDEADGKLADVVRLAFKLRVEGLGYHAIGQRLSDIAPPRAYKKSKSAVPRTIRWTPTRVKRMLENRAYVGPIIDDLTFVRAQRVRERLGPARPQRSYTWPLSGVIRCYCGRAMVGLACGTPANRIRYYRCAATWHHAGRMRLVRADDLEEQFIKLLERLRASASAASRYRRAGLTDSPKMLDRALREAQKELERAERARQSVWDLHARGLVRDDDVQERLDSVGKQRDAALAKVSSLREQLALAHAAKVQDRDADKMLRAAAGLYCRASADDQRRIARAVAATVGGLCVAKIGRLTVRRAEDIASQRRRHADEV